MGATFQSDHFTLNRLAEGVYAAVAREMGGAGSNTGVVDLGEQSLVFDAFENPQAAEDLLKACHELTGRSPAVVIISHFHFDHWAGLQVFAGRPILATHSTRQWMVPIAGEISEARHDPSWLEKDLSDTEARLAEETDPAQRRALQNSLARKRYSLEALPGLEPTFPNQTFEGKIIFHGPLRQAELIATGRGHTESDCILHLPQDRVSFIGDLGFFQEQPFMAHCFPSEWLAQLEGMAGWEIETYVPGHGPVGDKASLALQARYIRALEEMVGRVAREGGPVEDALRETLPEPFGTWQKVGRRFEANVRASFERQTQPGQPVNEATPL